MKIKFLISLALTCSFHLFGFNFGMTKYSSGNEIDPELKANISVIDNTIIEAIRENDSQQIKLIVSSNLQKVMGDTLDSWLKTAQPIAINNNFKSLNQFYLKTTKKNMSSSVTSSLNDKNSYNVNIQSPSDEIFISILTQESGLDKPLILYIYGKYSDEWKVDVLHIGHYQINGQTAPELYEKAKSNYDKGYFIDALINMSLSIKVLKPGGAYWQYQSQNDMEAFYKTVLDKVKNTYPQPIVIDKIKSKPQILGTFPIGVKQGYFPLITYLTKININDQQKLKEENDLIHQHIGEIFKGIDQDKKYIVYRAYNEMPSTNKETKYFGFIHELD